MNIIGKPAQPRQAERKFSESMRWAGILLRTFHIVFAAIMFGGSILSAPALHHFPWYMLVITTGLLLICYEWLHDPNWPHCGKAIAVYLHILLLVLVHIKTDLSTILLWAVICTGSIGSHMPRHFRHWSIIYGRYRKS